MTASPESTSHTHNMEPNPTTTRPRRESRDTGFPEPFNGDRNTTLPHPDADLSPNACISEADINPEKALSRARRSFLKNRKHRHTLQHGKITPQQEAMYSMSSLVSSDVGTSDTTPKAAVPSLSSVRVSKDDTDSIISQREDETPPTSPDVPTHRSKGGILSKFRRDSRR
jgi:hypothetical protein